jgi:hypothetical protein
MKLWAPRRFDAETFDASTVNKRLATVSMRIARSRR